MPPYSKRAEQKPEVSAVYIEIIFAVLFIYNPQIIC
jgi:hypothetical protein